MDITTMKPIAPSTTRRERSARLQTTYRLVSPSGASFQGMTLPVAGTTGVVSGVLSGVTFGADQLTAVATHTSIDVASFRHGRPPV